MGHNGAVTSRIEFHSLRAFQAIAETGQLTRAAERLHISQPALSAQIRTLEQELDQPLFVRSRQGMELTLLGRELLPYAVDVLQAVERLRQAANPHRNEVVGRLRIGTVSDPEFIRVGELLARIREQFPLVDIELHNEFTGAAYEEVRNGTLDASYYYGEIDDPSITGIALASMRYRVAGPIAWAERLAGADWKAIAAMPWVLAPQTSSHYRLTRDLLTAHGVEPARAIEADQEGVIANLVESELGLSLVRDDIAAARQDAGTLCVWDHAGTTTTLQLIYRQDRADEPALGALLNVLREINHFELVGAVD
jgi:DNA-binding transcriptional LysR family regulator